MPVNREILDEIARRGISRLCHFTHVESLPDIFRYKGVISQKMAESRNIRLRINDPARLDNHLRYVSASVQYPNLYVLSRFMDRIDPNPDHWVFIFFSPSLMANYSTLFCPVNAAANGGQFITGGVTGFDSMFRDCIEFGHHPHPGESLIRTHSHLMSSPTCLQAEVLVRDTVDADEFRAIVTVSEAAADAVRSCLTHLRTKLPQVWVVPELGCTFNVVSSIDKGQDF